MNPILTDRAKSGFPVSIGTGLALETLLEPEIEVYDDTRELPARVEIKDYNLMVINVSTLLRNLLGAVSREDLSSIKLPEYLDVLKEEIQYLNDLFVFQDLEPYFYIHTYGYVKEHYPPDKLRKATTLKQLQLEMIVNYCLGELQKDSSIHTHTYNIKINKAFKALIITHVPWDLLSYTEFLKLDLLESHTGVLKTRKDWNSKYHKLPNRDMSSLPFSRELLSIFGDNIMFIPDSLKKRVDLYEKLISKKTNPLASDNTIKMLLGTFS